MKTIFAVFLSLVLLGASAWAIPQTIVPNNVFLRSTGISFEDFAADPASFAKGAELKGKWAPRGNDTLVLTDPTAVFGVAADEVTAQQSGGQVQSIRVVIREKAGGKKVDLLAQIAANIRAYSGDETGSVTANGAAFNSKGVQITTRRGKAHEIVVEFTLAA